MILERTYSRLPTKHLRRPSLLFLFVLVAALLTASPLSAGAVDSKAAKETAVPATTGGDKSSASDQPAGLDKQPGGTGEQPATTVTPSATGEPPASGDTQASGAGESNTTGEGQPQPKPLPLSPEIQKLPTVKIPPGKLPVAILLPNFEQFHRAFTKHGREYTNRRLSATEALVRAKLQGNGCFIITEEAAHALSQYVIEVYLTRAKTSINLMAHGYQINGGLSRYRRTPGRLVRIGYNSLGEFDQLYSVDDFESKVLMLTDVFLDRTKEIRKKVAASAKKTPAQKGR